MSHEKTTLVAEARVFLDEFSGQGVPLQSLLRTGRFPEGWSARYLEFVERVSAHYGEALPVPREIMAVIYTASVYCTKRYLDWQRLTGDSDETSKQVVDQVRWAADRFVMGRYWQQGVP